MNKTKGMGGIGTVENWGNTGNWTRGTGIYIYIAECEYSCFFVFLTFLDMLKFEIGWGDSIGGRPHKKKHVPTQRVV